MDVNPILMADSYKHSHFLQTPDKTEFVSSYIEARSAKIIETDEIVFMGLEPVLQDHIARGVTVMNVAEAEAFNADHGIPFNNKGWMDIINDYHGELPLRIHAVPEGSICKVGEPMLVVENTDSRFPWLTSFVETSLLRAIWYPTTVATLSREAKKIITAWHDGTVGNRDAVPFSLHDFGARGVSSNKSAQIGGLAHLVNFMGSDTMEGIMAARHYYGEHMAGYSVAAAEHSTMTAYTRAGEVDAYRNMIKQFGNKAGAIFSIVSDSYDIYYACDYIFGDILRNDIMALGAINSRLVIRPDSGDPIEVLPKIMDILERRFGASVNGMGYKRLPPFLGILWGDGIDLEQIGNILRHMAMNGWAADNFVFGMGGGLLQKVDRDTFGFAMKASHMTIDGQGVDIFKDPITDQGKISKRGRQMTDRMVERFYNGTILNKSTFAEIRARAAV